MAGSTVVGYFLPDADVVCGGCFTLLAPELQAEAAKRPIEMADAEQWCSEYADDECDRCHMCLYQYGIDQEKAEADGLGAEPTPSGC